MKLLVHLAIFAVGAALGVWWGVNHPTQAADVAGREDVAINRVKAEVAKAKIELLEHFLATSKATPAPTATAAPTAPPAGSADYQKMLVQEKQNLTQAQQTTN
ncbi:MAG TPA: hypothetical protein VLI90_19455 [Tepidisphaeraceae bacterium]|nr:hypothetical protein [Tepidisphaeraceae bacterium]